MIALGCFEMALRFTKSVAVFKPIIRDDETGYKDKNIELILSYHNLDQDYKSTYAYTRTQATDMLAHDKQDEFIDEIINKYKALEEKYDFIVCEGSDFVGEGSFFEFDMNAMIAKNLGVPVLVLGQGLGRDLEDILSPLQLTIQSYQAHNCQIIGTIVNKVKPERRKELMKVLMQELPDDIGFLAAIPSDDTLSMPTVREVAEQMGAKVLFGKNHLDNLVSSFQSVAMSLEHYLKYLRGGSMAITPGDRTDIIMGTLLTNQSHAVPNISGMILTGGIMPSKEVKAILKGLPDPMPILSVPTFTFETSVRAEKVVSSIDKKSNEKIALSLKLFDKYVDVDEFANEVIRFEPQGMTPKMFLYNLRVIAGQNRKKIVLPEGNDIRILRASETLQKMDVVDLVILGKPAEIKALANKHHLKIDFSSIELIDPVESPMRKEFAIELAKLRKHKGLTEEIAFDTVSDVSYFGTMMVYMDYAQGMVSGAAHTTQHTIRPALQILKTKENFKTVSSVFFMCLEDRVLAYGDCAINPDPDADQLAEIAISSADTSKRFGIEPKVAMLSYSSGDSGKGADVEKVREATNKIKDLRPDILVEGPIQYDAAVDMGVGAKKLPGSPVAGQASVLIFPDLNTGNNTYKAVQRETGALAVGPVLQGLRKPVNDLSRGCLVEDIVNTVIITAIQAQDD